MILVKRACLFSILLSLAFSFSLAQSQSRKLIGFHVSSNIYSGSFRLSPGMTFEYKLRRNIGLETGIYYLTTPDAVIMLGTSASSPTYENLPVLQEHLYTPLLFKFYTSVINLSAGPSAEVYIHWKQIGNKSTTGKEILDFQNKVSIGYLLKVGKDIRLGRKLTLEPELLFGSIISFNNVRLSTGVGLKYPL